MELRVAIEKSFPGFTLDVAFEAAEPLGILGASGSGKTLTLRAIAGLENPSRGNITIDGRTLFDFDARVNVPSRARRIGLVFQNYSLFPHLTVAQNIAFGVAHLSKDARRQIISSQVARAHLAGFESHYPRELSGGQQQRVALARALATDPAALLLDEPFSALDTHLRSQVEREFREALADYRGAVLLVSHNLEEVYRICPNLLVLSSGKVAAFGPKDEIFRRPPNLATARLTGCKNISRARPIGEQIVEALDWGVKLRVEQKIPAPLGHVAIRANHIQLVLGSPLPNANVFPCWAAAINESPFRVTLYLKLKVRPTGPADYHVQVELTRDAWTAVRAGPPPWNVQLNPGCVFLLSD